MNFLTGCQIMPQEERLNRVLGLKRRSIRLIVLCMAAGLLQLEVAAQHDSASIAATPPMGWNSWNHFRDKITDKDVRAAADAIVASGMQDAGYIYVNIDDGWQGERDAQGKIHANSRFPDMRALSDYVHSKGLKLGIYSSPGRSTCAGFAGSQGYEEEDAETYAEWGIDYLKYDLCSFTVHRGLDGTGAALDEQKRAFEIMGSALKKTKRPIVFNLCQYGIGSVWEWGSSVGGHLWRTTDDIFDNYSRMTSIGFAQAGLSRTAGPGHWNDPDMLEVGNGGMTQDEYKTQMSLWAILAAPLLAGNDLANMSKETHAILANRGIIAIDQDPLGRQGDRLSATGPYEIWTKPLSGGGKAIGLFNRGEANAPISVSLRELGYSGDITVLDVWSGKTVPVVNGVCTVMVPEHGAVILRVG
jgi:alpha-galactosidase